MKEEIISENDVLLCKADVKMTRENHIYICNCFLYQVGKDYLYKYFI